MKGADRKAAIAAYKERKTIARVFAVRCAPSGQVWVGESRHLDTQQNGLWFALKQGGAMNRSLQDAWNLHGEAAFSFEALEQLAEAPSAYLQRAALKDRAASWRSELNALRF
jgi:hypothetical protein